MVAALLGLAEPPKPPDVADALALAVCHLTAQPLRRAIEAAGSGRRTVIGWLRGELVARSPEGRDHRRRGRRRVPPDGVTHAAGRGGRSRHARWNCTCTPTCARTPSCSTASPPPRSDGASRRCSAPTASAPPSPSPFSSALRPPDLIRAVLDEDLGALCTVPGVGRKTAARLVLDLRSRLELPEFAGDGVPGGHGTPSEARGEVRAALAELGYGPDEIRRALEGGEDEGTVEELLRQALRELAGATVNGRREVLSAPPDGLPGDAIAPGGADEALARPVNPLPDPAELADEARLRPRHLEEFLGQPQLTEHLEIVLEAARRREQPVDHLLFAGPPGLGKTSLAGIVAAEMGVGLRITSGPALVRAGDLAALLTDLQHGDVLVHRRDPPSAPPRRGGPVPRHGGLPARHPHRQGPDGAFDPSRPAPVHPGGRHHPHRVAHEPAARPLRLRGTPRPLRGRGPAGDRDALGGDPRGRRWSSKGRATSPRGPGAPPGSPTGSCVGCATSSRCAPRVPSRRRWRPRAWSSSAWTSSASTRSTAPSSTRLCRRFDGRPVGLVTLAHCVGEEPDTVEDAYEPYLLQQGLLQRTPRGRMATPRAFAHLGEVAPATELEGAAPTLW